MVREQTHGDGGLTRRRLLQGAAGAGVLGVAGCLWWGGDEDSLADLEAAYERRTVDVGEIREGGTLRYGFTENVSSFDPPHSIGVPATFVQEFFYEALTRENRDGDLYPWLAESYDRREIQDIDRRAYEEYMVELDRDAVRAGETAQVVVEHPDNDPGADSGLYLTVEEAGDAVDDGVFGMQFRYELHEGIEFTNGEELTAENVVRTYERYEGSLMSSQVFDQFLHAEAVDDYTVDLYAQVPGAEAERTLPTYVLPTEHVDLPPNALDPREGNPPIGTGPYVFDEFVDGEYLTVRRNEDYWLDLDEKDWWDGPEGWPDGPVIDEIDVRIVRDDPTRSAALQDDEIDVTHGLPADSLVDYQESAGFRVTATPSGGYTFMQFPVRVEPWDSRELRRAVNHLVPRREIVENVFSGWAEPAWAPLPSAAAEFGTEDYDRLLDDLRAYNEYDPDRADELVAEAGVETPVEVTIETNAHNDDRVRMVELIANSLERSGHFEVTIDTYEWTLFQQRYSDPDYHREGVLTVVSLSGTFDPGSYVRPTHHPDHFAQCCNFQNVDHGELTDAVEAAQYGIEVLEDEAERARRFDEVWETVVEYNANSYLRLGVEATVHSDDVVGFNAYPFTEQGLNYALYCPMDRQITYLDR